MVASPYTLFTALYHPLGPPKEESAMTSIVDILLSVALLSPTFPRIFVFPYRPAVLKREERRERKRDPYPYPSIRLKAVNSTLETVQQ